MDKKKKYLLYAIALATSLLAVLLVSSYVKTQVKIAKSQATAEVKTVTIIEKPEMKKIVVAGRDLYRGEVLEAEDLTSLEIPADALSVQGLFTDAKFLVGQVLNQDIYAGEWILDRKLLQAGGDAISSGVAELLEEGERAVRISVDRVTGLGGLLKPNDYVDVLNVFKSSDGKRTISRIVLENIEVLMVGNQSSSNRVEDAADYVSDVVLRLSFREAEYMALAQDVGKVRLILRNPADTKINDSNGVNVEAMEISDALKESRKRVVPRSERQTIQILQGNKVLEVQGK